MPLTRRYTPEHPPGETCLFGFDFSTLIPKNSWIVSARLQIYTNTTPPVEASGDFTWGLPNPDGTIGLGRIGVRDRLLYASISGGVTGTDYQFRWSATDNLGNVWPRTALCLCALTS